MVFSYDMKFASIINYCEVSFAVSSLNYHYSTYFFYFTFYILSPSLLLITVSYTLFLICLAGCYFSATSSHVYKPDK